MNIKKILIANRGEVARRIIRTAKSMNIATVAIYSDIDVNEIYVSEASEAYPLNGVLISETYLNIDKIMDIIAKSGADSVHPGYGFLSENAHFAQILSDHNIVFIGPSPSSMAMMGDKIVAKTAAIDAGINVVPGKLCVVSDIDTDEIVRDVGLPLIIKAVAGGGGRGMRIIHDADQLVDAIRSAQKEATLSFGNGDIFIEKYISNPRHIEIQVIADQHGNVVCLGERECSIQRFHQKVIEESPSIAVDDATRAEMYRQSIALAKYANYHSVGTIEFIMDSQGHFYFLEMNTRLQVEHPVTEYVTKLDLVELMIRIAENKKLPFEQDDISIHGWSIEARICAEDVTTGFTPSTGRILTYIEPTKRGTNRIDSGVTQGSSISQYYDSNIAKLITYGDSRNEAISEMKRSLSEFVIDGVSTNIYMLEAIMRNLNFLSGNFSTSFIQEEYGDSFLYVPITDPLIQYFVMLAIAMHCAREQKLYSASDVRSGAVLDNAKYIADYNKFIVRIGSRSTHYVDIYSYDADSLTVISGGEKIQMKHNYALGESLVRCVIDDDDRVVRINVLSCNSMVLSYGGVEEIVTVYSRNIMHMLEYMPEPKPEPIKDHISSSLSGVVSAIYAKEGDNVTLGQNIISIEAMKMENIYRAEYSTIIKKIHVKVGDTVNVGDLLVSFE